MPETAAPRRGSSPPSPLTPRHDTNALISHLRPPLPPSSVASMLRPSQSVTALPSTQHQHQPSVAEHAASLVSINEQQHPTSISNMRQHVSVTSSTTLASDTSGLYALLPHTSTAALSPAGVEHGVCEIQRATCPDAVGDTAGDGVAATKTRQGNAARSLFSSDDGDMITDRSTGGYMHDGTDSNRDRGTPQFPSRRFSVSSSLSDAKQDAPAHETANPLPLKTMVVLCIVIFSEPMSMTILFPFVYYMVRDFHFAEERDIGFYVGFIASSFSMAQFATSILWGWLSDRIGRRPVLLAGLIGNTVTITAFGLSKSLWWAIASRTLCGLLNGNVGVAKSVLGEITDHTNQAQAFSMFGLMFGIGMIIGPMLGGFLSHPATSFPGLFGGMPLFREYPYLLPCLVSALFSTFGFAIGLLHLPETARHLGGYQVLWADDEEIVTSAYETETDNEGDANPVAGLRRSRRGSSTSSIHVSQTSPLPSSPRSSVFAVGQPSGVSSMGIPPMTSSWGGSMRHSLPAHLPMRIAPGGRDIRFEESFAVARSFNSSNNSRSGRSSRSNSSSNVFALPVEQPHIYFSQQPQGMWQLGGRQRNGLAAQNGGADMQGMGSPYGSSHLDRLRQRLMAHGGHASRDESVVEIWSAGLDGYESDMLPAAPASKCQCKKTGLTLLHASTTASSQAGHAQGPSTSSGIAAAASDASRDDPDDRANAVKADADNASIVSSGTRTSIHGRNTVAGRACGQTCVNASTATNDASEDSGIGKPAIAAISGYGLLAFQNIMFDETFPLWAVASPPNGLGFTSHNIGTCLSVMGAITLVCQLVIYPRIAKRMNSFVMYRATLPFYVAIFGTLPLVSSLLASSPSLLPFKWGCLLVLMGLRYFAGVTAFTSVCIMVSNSAKRGQLGIVNGVGQTCASFVRAVGPALGGVLWAWSCQSGLPFPFDGRFVFVLMASLAAVTAVHAWTAIPASVGHLQPDRLNPDEPEERSSRSTAMGGAH